MPDPHSPTYNQEMNDIDNQALADLELVKKGKMDPKIFMAKNRNFLEFGAIQEAIAKMYCEYSEEAEEVDAILGKILQRR